MCLLNTDRQHDDVENNLTIPTITLGQDIIWFVFVPISVDFRNEITCFGCVSVNTIVEMNLTALESSFRLRDCLNRSGA